MGLNKRSIHSPLLRLLSQYSFGVRQPWSRELAIVLEDTVLVGDMVDTIKKSSDFIETVDLFDVYKGEHIEAGKKSVAISLVLRNKKGTLKEEEISKVINKVLDIIRTKFGGQ